MKCARLIVALVVVTTLCGACATRQSRSVLVDPNVKVLRVKVTQSGDIYVDGQPESFEEAAAALERLKKENGAVLYYREESAQHQAHPNALKIIHKIEELNLPVGLSEKDFE
jgi:biopolymer transport protein ExbD